MWRVAFRAYAGLCVAVVIFDMYLLATCLSFPHIVSVIYDAPIIRHGALQFCVSGSGGVAVTCIAYIRDVSSDALNRA